MAIYKLSVPKKPISLNQKIVFETLFGAIESNVIWKIEAKEDATEVSWRIKGEIDFFYRFMTDKLVEDLKVMEERGLELFEESILRKMKIYSITSQGIVDYSGGFYLYLTTSSKIDQIESKFPLMLKELKEFIESNNIRTSGRPFSIYHKYDLENASTMFSVCIPIPERIITPKETDILTGFMERGKYYKTTLKGSYNNSNKAWEQSMLEVDDLLDYVMLEKGEPFEVYANELQTITNPADLITEIYIPIKKVKAID